MKQPKTIKKIDQKIWQQITKEAKYLNITTGDFIEALYKYWANSTSKIREQLYKARTNLIQSKTHEH